MKHIGFVVVLSLAAFSGLHAAEEGQWYIGGAVGASNLTIDTEVSTDNVVNQTEDQGSAYKVYGGYHFTDNLAVELEYGDLGAAEVTTTSNATGEIGHTMMGVSAKYDIPLSDSVTGFAKIGYAQVSQGLDSGLNSDDYEVIDADGVFGGLGLEYEFADGWAGRAEYEVFNEDTSLATLGVTKYFGKSTPVVAPPPKAPQKQTPTVCQQPIALNRIHFATNSARLNQEAMGVLSRLANDVKRCPSRHMTVVGHTDSRASKAYNMKLSQRRAQSVVNFLVSQGVNSGQLSAMGKGEDSPAANNRTRQGRAQNRRVEVYPSNMKKAAMR